MPTKKITSKSWLSKQISALLALTTVCLSFALFFVFVYAPLSPEKKDIIIYILGVLSAIDSQIFSYYFGSSEGSDINNKLLNQANLDNNKLLNQTNSDNNKLLNQINLDTNQDANQDTKNTL